MNIEEGLVEVKKCKKPTVDRDFYVDVAKGIGIFFVVWGHIILHGPVYNFIYSFHMPLFFLLSGLLFNISKYKTLKEFCVHRCKTLIIPYLVFSFITYIYWVVIENPITDNEGILTPFLQIFISQGSAGYMLHNIPMWFVLCLFAIEIIYFLLKRRLNNKSLFIVCCVLAIVGCAMTLPNTFFDFTKLFWSINVALVAIPFYMIGNLISEKFGRTKIKQLILSKKVISVIIMIIAFALLCILSNVNSPISMGTEELGNWLLFYLNAFIGIVMILIISVLMERNKLFQFLGRNSFFIMAMHFPIRKPITLIISKIFSVEMADIYNSPIFSFIVTILTIIVNIVLIKIIEKLKMIYQERKEVNLKWKKEF